MRKVLNVGGNSKKIPLPTIYQGWDHVLLDIDPTGGPDVVCDARQMTRLPAATYDSVYCSHNLEHYYQHELKAVLAGMRHVLKEDGFLFIEVPDMENILRYMVKQEMDLQDVIYHTDVGPITIHDLIFGYGVEIERSGQDFFAHKTGFSRKSISAILQEAGFRWVRAVSNYAWLEIRVHAFKEQPSAHAIKLLDLPV